MIASKKSMKVIAVNINRRWWLFFAISTIAEKPKISLKNRGLGGRAIIANIKRATKRAKTLPLTPLNPFSAPAMWYFPCVSKTPVEIKSAGFNRACAPK